ncbi:MAG: glycoside hydrolase family 172 protein [Armatimonadota bacterium]
MLTEGRPAALVAILLASSVMMTPAAAEVRDEAWFLREMTDLDRLPLLEKGVRCAQFSSYDRASRYDAEKDEYLDWGANSDWGKYIREEGNVGVMAEIEGPGCIQRIWSANPQGRIQFFFDGEEQPRVDMNFADMFNDSTPPFLAPLCGIHGRGQNSYLPMPFAKSVRVISIGGDQPPRHYYHITYRTFPKGTTVKTFSPSFDAGARAALADARYKLSHCGTDPQPLPARTRAIREKFSLPTLVGRSIEIEGPGVIRQLLARMTRGRALRDLRNVLLRIYWDGEKEPSVEAPLGDFFGTAPGINPYESLPLGMRADGLMYCYWRMQFWHKARVEVVNQGPGWVNVGLEVRYTPGWVGPGGPASSTVLSEAGYFHAKWRREAPSHTFDYPFLEATGWGKYVGVVMNVHNLDQGWWGEGDEKVYIDGEKFPSTFGTGSEDYFGDAWGHRHFVHAYHGNTKGQGPGFSNKWSVYRWHVGDAIPYEQSFKITIENYRFGGDNVDYSSTAYWYAARGGEDFFWPTYAVDRQPWPFKLPDVQEVEEGIGPVRADLVKVVKSADMPQELSGGQGVLIGFPGGARALDIGLDAGDGGTYHIRLRYGRGPRMGTFRLTYEGEPIGPTIDAYATSPGMSGLEEVGKVRLEGGRQAVRLEIVGLNRLATGSRALVDCLHLQPIVAENAIEGEGMRILGKTGDAPLGPQDLRGQRGRWSGNRHLWFRPAAAGTSFTLELPVAEEGDYKVSAFFTKAIDYGIVQVQIDGTDIGEPFDGFNDGVIPSGRVVLGNRHLTKGNHRLTFKVVGKNDKSTSFMVGVDCVTLDAAE